MTRLSVRSSVELLLAAQEDNGAFPASPVHQVYRYAWLRDGSWCAYALDGVGQRDAAAAWHHWVASTLIRHARRFDEAIEAVQSGRGHGPVMMPARFTLAGQEQPASEEQWPNHQTDSYGFWLWALGDHVRRGGVLDSTLTDAIDLVIRYLLVAGDQPCYDCWEESPGQVHTSSLASVAAGLRDASALLNNQAAAATAARLMEQITGPNHTVAGTLIRFPGDTRVDGSLLWTAVPLSVVDPNSDLYRSTVTRIRDELHIPDSGVRRYQGDTFYGGSQWILLAAALGWAALKLGDRDLATSLHRWIQAQADDQGHLPEQVPQQVQSRYMLTYWRQRWGNTATPLLWSHAMHIVLTQELSHTT